jgi:putative transposase
VVDEYARASLAIDVAGSIRSGRVIEVLSHLVSAQGAPRVLRSDNGPVESFNGKFRDECLSMEWFRSRAEAKVLIENWRRHYNEVRPHSSLRNMTPSAFRASCVGLEKPRPDSKNVWSDKTQQVNDHF